jgi:ATP-dependent DNA ligase
VLARSGPLPTRGDWAYEVKWDGFRALVSTEGGLRVRSRRGWNMTARRASGLVAYILDGQVHLQRIADGADTVVALGQHAAFTTDGLIYVDRERIHLRPFVSLPPRAS